MADEARGALRFSLWCDFRPAPGRPATVTTYGELLDEIVLAEQLGFHGIWASEHHGVDDSYLPAPFTALAAVAGRTRRLTLGTNVLLLPLWPIRLIAEEAAVLDLISEGRLILGLGLGYVQHEFAAFGVSRRRRRALMEAGITYLRAAFSGEGVPDGVDGAKLPVTPLPAQGGKLPIYIGGGAEPALDRAARVSDGFLASNDMAPLAELISLWNMLRPRLEAYGRDVASFPFVAGTYLWVSDDPERDWATLLAPAIAYQSWKYDVWGTDNDQPVPARPDPGSLQRGNLLIGTPDEVVARIGAIQARVPLTEICFWSHLPGIPHDAAAANLERIARHVLPAFT